MPELLCFLSLLLIHRFTTFVIRYSWLYLFSNFVLGFPLWHNRWYFSCMFYGHLKRRFEGIIYMSCQYVICYLFLKVCIYTHPSTRCPSPCCRSALSGTRRWLQLLRSALGAPWLCLVSSYFWPFCLVWGLRLQRNTCPSAWLTAFGLGSALSEIPTWGLGYWH